MVSSDIKHQVRQHFDIEYHQLSVLWYLQMDEYIDHGRPQKFFQGGQHRNFAYPFQAADDAMQTDVHKTLRPFNPVRLCSLNLNSQSYV